MMVMVQRLVSLVISDCVKEILFSLLAQNVWRVERVLNSRGDDSQTGGLSEQWRDSLQLQRPCCTIL